jgi:hypothetical protein
MNKENKKRFKDLYIKNKLENYPSFIGRENCIPEPELKENGANALTKLVIKWIEFNNGQSERISNTGTYRDNKIKFVDCIGRQRIIGSGVWTKGTGTNGTADISATIKGRSVKIEIKWQKDRQSEAQIKYEQSITKAGGIYLIVKNFDDFIDWWDNFESTYLF